MPNDDTDVNHFFYRIPFRGGFGLPGGEVLGKDLRGFGDPIRVYLSRLPENYLRTALKKGCR